MPEKNHIEKWRVLRHFPLSAEKRTVLALTLLFAITSGFVCAQERVPDYQITNAVDDELVDDAAVPAWNIDVSTVDGIVTLDGSVSNILARERAEKIAETVKGVKAIVNQLDVSAPFRNDADIKENVKDALLWDPATESWEVEVSVNDGIVTLEGSVDSWQERELAAKVAKGVRGVKGIENDIDVNYKTDRPDAEIQEEVEKALRWDAYVDNAMIDVEVSNGEVKLTGTVGSAAEKREAGYEAWVAGVSQVDNELDVQWWERDERLRKDKYVEMSDNEIQQAVKDALLYDPRVASFRINIEADGGYVTLRGTVDNLKAKRAAAQDARSVVGVWSVNNRIKVRPMTPTDEEIEENVGEALTWDPYVERYEITVAVVDGEVYLYGDVESAFEKAQAEDVTARQRGVVDVNNFLSVNEPYTQPYSPYVDDYYFYNYEWYTPTDWQTMRSDWEIEEDIKDELFWSPFVDEDEVNVEVEDGAATLTGVVDTWSEREAATENAIEGGAVTVDNDLAVDYGPEYYAP